MRKSLNLLKNLLFEDYGKNRDSDNLTRICKKLGIYSMSNDEIKQRAEEMTNPPRIVIAPTPIIENLQENINEDIEEPLFTQEEKIKIKIVSKNIDNVSNELVEKKKKKKRKSKEKNGGQSKTSKDADVSLSSNGLDHVIKKDEENFYYIKNHKFHKEEVDKQIGLFNDMAKNYYELDDRATELFKCLKKTTDEDEKEIILENYNDYKKSAKKMLENILIAFPY